MKKILKINKKIKKIKKQIETIRFLPFYEIFKKEEEKKAEIKKLKNDIFYLYNQKLIEIEAYLVQTKINGEKLTKI